jgi:hypothetical protein
VNVDIRTDSDFKTKIYFVLKGRQYS